MSGWERLTAFACIASIDESNGDFTCGSLDYGSLLTDWVVARDTIDRVGIELDVVEGSGVDLVCGLAQRTASDGTACAVFRTSQGLVVEGSLALEFAVDRGSFGTGG